MLGKKVLLVAYTHSALDSLLLKLKELEISFLRIASSVTRVHESIKQHTDVYAAQEADSVPQYKRLVSSHSVLASTVLNVGHSLLSSLTFDLCIIDEASQSTLPHSLGPLSLARKFVLVGDHYQLPPLVKSKHAREQGLAESLFFLLAAKFPHSVAPLTLQYRMSKQIMLLPNSLTYEGKLKCGSRTVEKVILFPLFDSLKYSLSKLGTEFSCRSQRVKHKGRVGEKDLRERVSTISFFPLQM